MVNQFSPTEEEIKAIVSTAKDYGFKEPLKPNTKPNSTLVNCQVLLQKYNYQQYETYVAESGSAPAAIVMGYSVGGGNNWVIGWTSGDNYKIGIDNT